MDKKVYLVFGLGISGRAVAEFLLGRGFSVYVADDDEKKASDFADGFAYSRRYTSARISAEALTKDSVARFTLRTDTDADDKVCNMPMVLYGVSLVEALPPQTEIIQRVSLAPSILQSHWLAVRFCPTALFQELDLAYEYIVSGARVPKLLGVTGTNGKTTTVLMLKQVLEGAGISVAVAGNIGVPLLQVAQSTTYPDVIILELSSFQLEKQLRLRLDIAILTNIAPNHLEVHSSYEHYIRSKLNILSLATGGSVIYNSDCELLSEKIASLYGAELLPVDYQNRTESLSSAQVKGVTTPIKVFLTFTGNGEADLLLRHSIDSQNEKEETNRYSLPVPYAASQCKAVKRGVDVLCGKIYFHNEKSSALYALSDLSLCGHNTDNALLVTAAAVLLGVEGNGIFDSLSSFVFPPHRLQLVRVLDGKRYVNDSKSTNIASTLSAVNAVEGNVALILGGKDKNVSYSTLFSKLPSRVKHVLLVGENSPIIKRAADSYGYKSLMRFSSLRAAVNYAKTLAVDCVLFSPSASSFDLYQSYVQRGLAFAQLVEQL